MYCITDEQMEFILGDIRARGVETEDLQLNLLDHICCIIEQQLEENGDFELFYSATIRKFYKDELREIEEETRSLLTNKNYYVMKKVMIYSGTFAAVALTAGIILKYMHAHGASVMLVIGIVTASIIFIPLLFALKVKEKQASRDKLLVGLGTLAAINISMGILFKIMHWPGANVLSLSCPAILILLFLPIYFFTGIRNPERKVNTIVTSILMIVGCGLFFSLMITPQNSRRINERNTLEYLRNEQILANEQHLLDKYGKATADASSGQGRQIFQVCEQIKSSMLNVMGVQGMLDVKTATMKTHIPDYPAADVIRQYMAIEDQLEQLRKDVVLYNASVGTSKTPLTAIPTQANLIDASNVAAGYRVVNALNDLVQIQMLVLQNDRTLGTAAVAGD